MANALYDKGKEGLVDGTCPFNGANIRAALVLTGYVVDLAADVAFTTAVSAYVAAMGSGPAEVAMTTLTQTGGVARADSAVFPAVTTGQDIIAIVIYDSVLDRVLAYIDTATGLPDTSDGSDVVVTWDAGADGIFAL